MGAVADLADFRAKLASPWQGYVQANKVGSTLGGNLGRWHAIWISAPFGGGTPTSPVVLDKDTPGAIDPYVRFNPSGDLYLAAAELISSGMQAVGTIMLIDRLSYQGGLDATVTTADLTTNLPTAALTRYTSGAGVMACIEVYATLGATASTLTVKYTNQAGTGGKVSQPTVIGGTNNREQHRTMFINLAAGDTGIRSIESYTLAGTTGTAGQFGFTLFKPLAIFPVGTYQTDWNGLFGGGGNLPEIVDNACLAFLANGSAGVLFSIQGALRMIEA